MIPQKVIEEIRERTDIVEVIGSYIELQKSGRNFKALCPFHREKTPSFIVSPEKQIYHCFGCGKGGNVFHFLMDYEGIGFVEAVKKLASGLNIDVDRYLASGEGQERLEPYYRAMQFAADFYRKQLIELREAQVARDYLEKRGIDDEIAEEFSIGYAPSVWDELYRRAMDGGIGRDVLLALSLVVKQRAGSGYRDYFRNRIIFPIMSISRRTIGLAGRVLNGSQPKYLNTAESPIYSKGRVLYGLSHSRDYIRKTKTAIIVEGYMDYLMLWKNGFKNVCAVCGTSFTPDQAHLLARYANRVYIINDGDRAGIRAAVRTADILLPEGLDVRLVVLPENEDPDSFVTKKGAEEMQRVIDSAPDYFTYLRGEAEKGGGDIARKDLVVKHILGTVSRVDDDVRKELYLQEVSKLFSIPVEALRADLNRMRRIPRQQVEERKEESIREKIQKQVLRVGFESDQFAREIIETVDETAFEGDVFRGAFKALEDALDQNKSVRSPEFMAGISDPEIGKLLSEIALMEPPPGPLDSFLKDALKWLKKENLKQDLRLMKKRIEELENMGGDEASQERVAIAEAYRKVSRELQRLNFKEGERGNGS